MRDLQEAIGRHYQGKPTRPVADPELRRGVAAVMAMSRDTGRARKENTK
ncbi:hypothetical protein ACH4C6_14850 [Streptomyces sp. NPDC017943]